jgi:hypothetical protein
MKRASEYNRLTGRQYRYLIEQSSCLHRDDPTEVVDIVRILKSMADKVCTLADYCFTNFARSLTCYDQ